MQISVAGEDHVLFALLDDLCIADAMVDVAQADEISTTPLILNRRKRRQLRPTIRSNGERLRGAQAISSRIPAASP